MIQGTGQYTFSVAREAKVSMQFKIRLNESIYTLRFHTCNIARLRR